MTMPESVARLTEAEYVEIERAAEFKSEFFDGEMFAMAGGTPQHSLIGANLVGEFRNRLKDKACAAYNADLRIKVEATGLYTYPDLSVLCGPLKFAPGADDTVVNPSVLVEVLSDSTEAYDRGRKFEHYRKIPTLREYLLVSQKGPRIEQFIRQSDEHWLMIEAAGLEKSLALPSLQITVSLAEIFLKVEFVAGPIRAALGPPR
jgi:Uma2 family endonuclease